LLTKLKGTVESWMKSGATAAHNVGLSPNQISGLGAVLGFSSSLIYWQSGRFFANQTMYAYCITVAVILLLTSGYCDALDGIVGRMYGEVTVAGGFLDSLLDRYVEASIFCSLILGGLCDILWGLMALIGSLLTSYARARSEAADIPMETIGVIERAERLIIISLASMLSIFWTDALQWAIILLAITTNITVLRRAQYFFRKVNYQEKP